MGQMHNSRAGPAGMVWRKSGRSGAAGNCVELAPAAPGAVAVRNSRHPDGPLLIFPTADMAAFLAEIKDGDFDDLIAGSPHASPRRSDVRGG